MELGRLVDRAESGGDPELASALGALADSTPMPVHLRLGVPGPCSAEAEATGYFVVSEALTNAARHSNATQVTVRVSRTKSHLRLDVSDDGCGGAVLRGGLQGLADRVASLGGVLTLDSPTGRGTRLTVELPCR